MNLIINFSDIKDQSKILSYFLYTIITNNYSDKINIKEILEILQNNIKKSSIETFIPHFSTFLKY